MSTRSRANIFFKTPPGKVKIESYCFKMRRLPLSLIFYQAIILDLLSKVQAVNIDNLVEADGEIILK